MKKLFLAILPLFAVSFSYAQLISYQQSPLQQAAQSTTLLSTIGGSAGAANSVYHNTWLVRNVTGNDWYSTRVHDGISIDVSFLNPQINTQTWWERDPANNIQSWGSSNLTYLTINQGHVGIGTISPSSILQIVSGSGNQVTISNNSPTLYGTENQSLVFTGTNNANGGGILELLRLKVTSTNGGIAAGQIDFLQNGSTKPTLSFSPNNYVGIGTTSPNAPLTVNGTIHASEVLVDQTVAQTPDYVFDKDYDLTSLKDVKTYIDQNHHLPEIPSAAQVTKDGINLGEMNTKLLKKIEELTLYLIEKDKEVKAQAEQSKEQSEKSKQQEYRITQLEQLLTPKK